MIFSQILTLFLIKTKNSLNQKKTLDLQGFSLFSNGVSYAIRTHDPLIKSQMKFKEFKGFYSILWATCGLSKQSDENSYQFLSILYVERIESNMNCKYVRIRTKKGVHYKYCTLLKKEINECYNCINKEYKEHKKLSTKNVHKSNKRNSKITKLERNRTSIFTDDLEHCIICGNKKDNLHEVIYGSNRLKSMKYGFVLPLCFDHHVGNRGIHSNRELDLFYKKKCQEYFEDNIGNRIDFIRIFGKSYL